MKLYGAFLARPVRRSRKPAAQDGSMTDATAATRTLVVERAMPHPPEKIWRAEQGPLLEARSAAGGMADPE
jgi:hypothetical protein